MSINGIRNISFVVNSNPVTTPENVTVGGSRSDVDFLSILKDKLVNSEDSETILLRTKNNHITFGTTVDIRLDDHNSSISSINQALQNDPCIKIESPKKFDNDDNIYRKIFWKA